MNEACQSRISNSLYWIDHDARYITIKVLETGEYLIFKQYLLGAMDANPVLAKPSGACCLKGSIHEGKSRGSFVTIADVETYIARPQEGKANNHILLYFPDVWGMFPNGLLIMDAFADAGYLVLGLDYFRGVSFPLLGKACCN
jgi:hypothetical protein